MALDTGFSIAQLSGYLSLCAGKQANSQYQKGKVFHGIIYLLQGKKKLPDVQMPLIEAINLNTQPGSLSIRQPDPERPG